MKEVLFSILNLYCEDRHFSKQIFEIIKLDKILEFELHVKSSYQKVIMF